MVIQEKLPDEFLKIRYQVEMKRYLPLFEIRLVICIHVFCQILTSLFKTPKGVDSVIQKSASFSNVLYLSFKSHNSEFLVIACHKYHFNSYM